MTNRIDTNKLIEYFQVTFPHIVAGMSESNHHYDYENLNPYHLEGDVWTHTMMVVQQADRLIKEKKAVGFEDELRIAALLHDLGKPIARTPVEETKRVRFIGHEGASFHMAIGVLDKLLKHFGFSKYKRITMGYKILNAIAFHDVVWKGIKGNDFEKKFTNRFQSNRDVAELVVLLSLADGAGRFYLNGEREYSEDAVYERCFKIIDSGKLDRDRVLNMSKEVIIMVGLPGSGKSTFIDDNDCGAFDDYVIISRDNLVEEYAKNHGVTYNEAWKAQDFDSIVNKQIRQAIAGQRNVVIDKTHMGQKARRRSLAQFPKSYMKTAVVVTEDIDVIEDRLEKRREEGHKTIHPDVVRDAMLRFRPPMYDDFDSILYI